MMNIQLTEKCRYSRSPLDGEWDSRMSAHFVLQHLAEGSLFITCFFCSSIIHQFTQKMYLISCLVKSTFVVAFCHTHTYTHSIESRSGCHWVEEQTLSWVLLTLFMLAPRGNEAWLPPSRCPQALHKHNHHSSSSSSSFSSCSFPTFGFTQASL